MSSGKGGRLPTPKLRELGGIQRTHHDLTTPAVGNRRTPYSSYFTCFLYEQTLTKEDIQMENKLMKRCSTSHLSGKNKLKQQWDITLPLIEWPKLRTLTTPRLGEDVEQWELPYAAGGNAKRDTQFGTVWWFLTKLNTLSLYNPATVLLSIYSKELKT